MEQTNRQTTYNRRADTSCA